MTTLDRLRMLDATEDVLGLVLDKDGSKFHDPVKQQELQLRAALYDRWDRQVEIARHAMHVVNGALGLLTGASGVMQVFGRAFGGNSMTIGLNAAPIVASSFTVGRDMMSTLYTKQTGRAVPQRKSGGLLFGAMFGLTEQHALEALNEQLIIAAGSFWDDQLQDSIKREVESWFTGSITREELTDKLQALINERLATDGRSLARSYFDNLSTHIVNSSRNIGSFYQGKYLGATHYTLYNPRDKRTSPICQAVTNGQVFEMEHAEATVVAKLQSRTSQELQQNAPFLTPETVGHAKGPVPPLHFPKCRTQMHMKFD